MREIKFRAWIIQSEELGDKEIMLDDVSIMCDGWILDRFADNGGYIEGNLISRDKGDKFVLMQYTGLKDRDDKEIYEGDILTFEGNMTADNSFGVEPNGYIYNETNIHAVVWNDELAGWEPKFAEEEEWKYKRDTRGLMCGGDCEVVGNIYENPDLLV